jgi:hypothetical protein
MQSDTDDAAQAWYESAESRAGCEWRPTTVDPVSGNATPVPGIAEHKLVTDLGWLVTAEECREALEAWQEASRQASSTGNRLSVNELRQVLAGKLHFVEECASEALASCPIGPLVAAGLRKTRLGVDDNRFVELWSAWLDLLNRGSSQGGFTVA